MENFKVTVWEADNGGYNYYVNSKWFGWSVSRNDAFKKAMDIVKKYQG